MHAPQPATEPQPLLDWARIGRRIGWSAAVLGASALVGSVIVGLATGGPVFGELGTFVGIALAGLFVAELFFVGGAAARAMLRAGERGDRLAGGDVGLLPPQISRWARRRR